MGPEPGIEGFHSEYPLKMGPSMKELAEFLKSEREKRRVTLRSVSEKSGISVDMLSALESGDLDRFGASLLIRSIIRGYCEALQIDAAPLLEKFSSQIAACDIQQQGIRKFGQQMKILRKKRRMVSFPLFLLALATIGICFGGMWISEKRARLFAPPAADRIFTQEDLPAELQQKLVPGPNAGRKQPSPEAALKSPVNRAVRDQKAESGSRDADKALQEAEKNIKEAEKVKGTGGNAVAPTEAAKAELAALQPPPPQAALSNSMEVMADDRPAPAVEDRKKHKFVVEADDKTWFQVRIDDKDTRSAMLNPGDKREWTAEKGVQVVVGNAGGIRMKWDDQPVKAPRDSGRVLRFRLPDFNRETE
jgi:cytoskeleton protein RodZ